MTAHPWDQQPGETPLQYVQFLHYRDAGPSRTVAKGYRKYLSTLEVDTGGRKGTPPGSYRELATRNQWRPRAEAWDVSRMRAHGSRIAPLLVFALEQIARKLVTASRRIRPGHKAWKDVLATVATVQAQLELAKKAGADAPPADVTPAPGAQETPGVHPEGADAVRPADADRAAVE